MAIFSILAFSSLLCGAAAVDVKLHGDADGFPLESHALRSWGKAHHTSQKPASTIKQAMENSGSGELSGAAHKLLKSTESAEVIADFSTSEGVLVYGRSIASRKSLNPAAVYQMEVAVTDLIMHADKATPMGDSVVQIETLIDKTMMPKVLAAHKANQHELTTLVSQLQKCSNIKLSSFTAAQKQKVKYEATSPLHKSCRANEAALATESQSCGISVKASRQVRDLTCQAFKRMGETFGSEPRNHEVAKKMQGESTRMYIKRVTSTYCGTNTGGSMFDKFEAEEKKCQAATLKATTVEKECVQKNKDYKSKQGECNNVQNQMDSAACARAVLVKDACESYAQCHTGGTTSYNTTATTVQKEEKDRKGEWKALKRMKCLITAFKDSKVDDAEVKACKAKVHDTTALDIKYPVLPNMEKCIVPDRYPATASYKKAEFAPLPVLAKGNPEANECYGIIEINTRPKDGSPGGCKCERMTMNGPFSPGALVKCVGCLDVYRSTDKDSCPDGTKLFSPRSRTDWKTFIASTAPVRSPNWIIDITRPQNGCGGCTKAPMSKDIAAQNSWVTSDGSAWWLRSTTYSEPNGDYTANCYLDLWHTPRHEDSITFNDKSCSYHSNAYFCQAKQISTKPKHGSPPGCNCDKVELVGKYSAGLLLKCIGCLDVRRANDKNSCPEGTKIFSPRSREDWLTFIQSANALRSPHWIIDITRPQNGCGGCTQTPMNFETPQQTSWKTEDKSPWWLRSTKYSEPNGDYEASCYLDLWHNPANSDSVTFNDQKCGYHSNAYYCQPTLASISH